MLVKVRFAPSPTGPLHIGGARSALFNYLFAQGKEGTFILRSEDTDLERSSRKSEEDIVAALRWLGIEWQEGIAAGGAHGPYRQTERLDIYQKYIDLLLANNSIYECYCTEEELEEERQRLIAQGESPRYLGKCFGLTTGEKQALRARGLKPSLRFHVPAGKQIVIADQVRGQVVFESDGIGDFIIVKSDGMPTYNFAVVIDDIEMEITHVIRGEEHLSNTPRQILIFEALGQTLPQFAHVSLILNAEGRKMSKRDGHTSVADYQARGYLPEAVVNFIALLGWSPKGEQEFFSMEELKTAFSLNNVSKAPAVFDLQKLNHINAHYIKEAPNQRLAALALPFVQAAGLFCRAADYEDLEAKDHWWLETFIGAVKDKIDNLAELADYLPYFRGTDPGSIEEEARQVLQGETVPQVRALFRKKIESASEIDLFLAKRIFKEISKELGLKGRDVFMPLRVSVTGQVHGPDLDWILTLLERENILARLDVTEQYVSRTG